MLPITFIILVAVGSDYNLLLIARVKEEVGAGLHTGLIRALGSTGGVVTSAGLVFAFTMLAMLTSDLRTIGQVGSTVCIGLLLDTLIVRSFVVPCILQDSRALVLVADAGALPSATAVVVRFCRGDAMNLSLWAILTIIALVGVVVFTTIAFVYVRRLLSRPTHADERGHRERLWGAEKAAETRTDVG